MYAGLISSLAENAKQIYPDRVPVICLESDACNLLVRSEGNVTVAIHKSSLRPPTGFVSKSSTTQTMEKSIDSHLDDIILFLSPLCVFIPFAILLECLNMASLEYYVAISKD
ncbi:hypothetical protein pdam_00001365, partial [Pocillopora damicornis]